MRRRLAMAFAAWCLCGSALGGGSRWSLGMTSQGMNASLPAGGAGGTLSVDCDDGTVAIDLGTPATRSLTVSFGQQPGRALALEPPPDGAGTTGVAETTFAARLAGYDGQILHVQAEAEGASQDFDLSGTVDAFAACGLAVTPEKHPEARLVNVTVFKKSDPAGNYEPVAGQPYKIKVRRRVTPDYPAGAPTSGRTPCRVDAYIDETGVPFDTAVRSCPIPFRTAATEALMKWRWQPLVVDGVAVTARAPVVFMFVP